MTTLISWLIGEAGGWIAGALAALITLAGVYLRGRADGKAKLRADADRAYRETRERMDDAEAAFSDDTAVLRDQLRARDPGLR